MSDSHPELPLDPDVETAESHPVHLAPANIALVAVGGAVGTGIRAGLQHVVPHWGSVPVVTLVINVVGAFVLGVLLEVAAGPSVSERWSRRLRLGVGTGVLGGFTTYSSLAADTATLMGTHPARAMAYALGTVSIGLVASVAGIAAGRARLRRRRSAVRDEPT